MHRSRHQSRKLTNLIASLLSALISFLFFFLYSLHVYILCWKLHLQRLTHKGVQFLWVAKQWLKTMQNSVCPFLQKLKLSSNLHWSCFFSLWILKYFICMWCCFPSSLWDIVIKRYYFFRWRNLARQSELPSFTKAGF